MTARWWRTARPARAQFRRASFSSRFSRLPATRTRSWSRRGCRVLPAGAGWAFDEVTRRHGDYALVGLGCVVEIGDGGRAQSVRLAACGIADRPVRLAAAERALTGTQLAAADLDAAVRASVEFVTMADDMNTSASYRRRVLGGLIRRLVGTAVARARGGR